jgi:hypothetical protein
MALLIARKPHSVGFGVCLFFLLIQGLTAKPADDLFPTIKGWKRSDSIKVFTPDNLYRFIDGAADAYLMQDFERLTVEIYTRRFSSIKVEIYKHRTEQHAYGIYSQERTSSVDYLPIGIEAYYSETILNFVIGTMYVKLTSFDLTDNEKDILRSIARAVAKKIGGRTTPPRMFTCFPEKGLVPHSNRFIGKDFLGYPFFRSAYTADYQIDSVSFELFVIDLHDSTECRAVWKEYLKSIKLDLNIPPSGTITVHDPYQGIMTFSIRGNILCGIIGEGPVSYSTQTMDAVHGCIQSSKK